MPEIQILSPHLADMIAAGEVVERPASVVKELMENSIDAGAKSITVEIRGGGMSLIRVTDDGCGMSPEDAGVAFLRHATSKLRSERDLEGISTLGFRGEALAAISAVSRIELLTRQTGAEEGTRVTLEAGEIQEMGPAGCRTGTDMLVRDLFYNTPARQKFMRSDRAESAACLNAAMRCALGHPEVSVRMRKDGEEQFFSPGDGKQETAVYTLLGRDVAQGMLKCAGEMDGIGLTGFVSAPHAGRGSRNLQHFFLNGRPFRSLTVQSALEQAYRNNLLTGRFPAAVLYLTLGCHKVDVNVHPTKQEVRFSEEKKVFDTVYAAVRAALEEREGPNTAPLRLPEQPREAKAKPKPDFFQSMSAAEFRGRGQGEQPPRRPQSPAQMSFSLPEGRTALPPLRQERLPYASSHPVPKPEIPREKPPERTETADPGPAPADVPEPAAIPEPAGESGPAVPDPEKPEPLQDTAAAETPDFPRFRVIGEALDTYILVETEETLLLIDKHACHERLNFDRLKAGLGPESSQTLLTPITWSPGGEIAELLEENQALLEEAGFETERFGEDGVILRAVPMDLQGGELAALEEIAEFLRRGRPEDRRDAILRSVACKAAIKAGSRSEPAELEALAARVVSGELRYCPHGRPVAVRLTRDELDRQFKRIV